MAEKPELCERADEASPVLDEREREEVDNIAGPRTVLVYEAIRIEGVHELARPTSSLIWSGLAAGMSMGFSMVGKALLTASLPDAEWRPLVSNFGYSFGFLIVILGRQQLFTENTLTVVLPLLYKRTCVGLTNVLRLWAAVLSANMVGTLLFAWAAASTGIFEAEPRAVFAELGVHAAEPPWLTVFAKAVVAGWLVALLVWLLPVSGSARPLVIVALTYLIGAAELAHIVAGSVEVASAVFMGALTWGDYLVDFLLPTLLGNTVGGVVLCSLLAHAQVKAEASMR